jgi:hypothetical protein
VNLAGENNIGSRNDFEESIKKRIAVIRTKLGISECCMESQNDCEHNRQIAQLVHEILLTQTGQFQPDDVVLKTLESIRDHYSTHENHFVTSQLAELDAFGL